MSSILIAKDLNKTYILGKNNAHHVLKNVSLDVQKGEFLSIMGPSGSGKSTLLYNISGMDKASGGTVLFDGENIETLSENELANLRLTKMGFIFQQSNLLKNLSIFDNIIVSAYLDAKEKKSSINQRAELLMKQTGISHLKDNDISQASGGELQRVSICRALINEPIILFGDEPTGALNSASTSEVMDILNNINQNDVTILIVSHDARVAARSDRVLFMMDGQIKGEFVLGKYNKDNNDWKKRELELLDWLYTMGF